MKIRIVSLCLLLCLAMLGGCYGGVKPVPMDTGMPELSQDISSTTAPATEQPEASPEKTAEPEPTAEPTAVPTEPATEKPEDLTETEKDQLLDLLMAAAGGVNPGEGFEEQPGKEQAIRILITYINHMRNSHLRSAGEIKDDMLYMTQEQVEILYRDLFAEGRFAYEENPELDMKWDGERYSVPLASGESLIPEIKDYQIEPPGTDGRITYRLQGELTKEFDPETKYGCTAVVLRNPDAFFGFVLVSFRID